LYARTSTEEQTNGIEAQRDLLVGEATRRGWTYEQLTEHASGKTLARRPILTAALEQLDRGGADLLAVTKLDRLARSTLDFATIVARSQKKGWGLIVLDLGLDMTTPNGKMAATVLMAVAEIEREMIAQRTREALAVVKSEGKQLGKPSQVPKATASLIVKLRGKGLGWRAVAEQLNEDGVPGPAGGAWHAASARRVFLRTAG